MRAREQQAEREGERVSEPVLPSLWVTRMLKKLEIARNCHFDIVNRTERVFQRSIAKSYKKS